MKYALYSGRMFIYIYRPIDKYIHSIHIYLVRMALVEKYCEKEAMSFVATKRYHVNISTYMYVDRNVFLKKICRPYTTRRIILFKVKIPE